MKIADKVIILNAKANLVGYTMMLDYTLCPDCFKQICLYNWIRLHDKIHVKNIQKKPGKVSPKLKK